MQAGERLRCFFTFVVILPACCDWPNMWHAQMVGQSLFEDLLCTVDNGSV